MWTTPVLAFNFRFYKMHIKGGAIISERFQ